MTPAVLTLSVVMFLAGDSAPSTGGKPPAKPSPFAPSLPELSQEEEARLDEIIDRFIKQDIGQLTGDEGTQARREFDKLGPDATFALIRGLNRAAHIEHSCPALVIAKKLAKIFSTTDDKELLDFARENIGAGVKESRHMATLKDLRMLCAVRKSTVERKGPSSSGTPTTPGSSSSKSLREMSVAELADGLGTERGSRQKLIVMELSYRPEDEALTVLAQAAGGGYDEGARKVAKDFLERALGRRSEEAVKEQLHSLHSEMRAAAARVAFTKKYRLGADLIDLLDDDFEDARVAAHKGLVQLAGGTDFGPEPKASTEDRTAAIKKWREWWAGKK